MARRAAVTVGLVTQLRAVSMMGECALISFESHVGGDNVVSLASDIGLVAEVTGQFGGNPGAIDVLEAVAGGPAADLRFVHRRLRVADLLPLLLDTRPSQVDALVEHLCRKPQVVVAGALVVCGNHFVRAAARAGRETVDAFVLVRGAAPSSAVREELVALVA